ncbi:MAG: DoxX family protein [Myxococcota bacterium]
MSEDPKPRSKLLHYGLWIVQLLLAFSFIAAGGMKLAMPLEELAANGIALAGRAPFWFVKFTGFVEVLGGVGLILPAALRILPVLTPAAAIGLVVTMIAAAGEHAMNAEFGPIVAPVILGLMAAFVAWGRLMGAPIASR